MFVEKIIRAPADRISVLLARCVLLAAATTQVILPAIERSVNPTRQQSVLAAY